MNRDKTRSGLRAKMIRETEIFLEANLDVKYRPHPALRAAAVRRTGPVLANAAA